MSKREVARQVAEASGRMLDELAAGLPQSPAEQWEQAAGGPDAARAIAMERILALSASDLMAVRWALLDQRRSLLAGLQSLPVAVAEIGEMADQVVLAEDRRADSIRRNVRAGKATATDYRQLAASLLDHHGSPAQRNAVFRAACAKEEWPLPSARSMRLYFQQAAEKKR